MSRSLVKLSPEARARKEAIDSMNPELQAEFAKIQDEIKEQASGNTMFYHKLGSRIRTVHQQTNKYGEGALDKIAKGLTVDRSIAYKAMAFSEQFTKEEVKELLDRPMADGVGSLSWSHFVQLVHIPEKKLVLEILEKVLEKSMTIRELRDELKRRESSGAMSRRVLTPKTSIGGMTQVSTMGMRLFEKLGTEFDKTIVKPLEKIEGEQITPDTIEKVQETVKSLDSLSEAAKGRADQMREIEGQMKEAAKQHKKDAKEAEAEARRQEKEDKAKEHKGQNGSAKTGRKRERRPVEA